MAIRHRIKQRYQSRNHQIVAELREAAGAAAPVDPVMKVKRLTAEVAVQMALLHGGDWAVHVDHQVGLIAIAKAPPGRPGIV